MKELLGIEKFYYVVLCQYKSEKSIKLHLKDEFYGLLNYVNKSIFKKAILGILGNNY